MQSSTYGNPWNREYQRGDVRRVRHKRLEQFPPNTSSRIQTTSYFRNRTVLLVHSNPPTSFRES